MSSISLNQQSTIPSIENREQSSLRSNENVDQTAQQFEATNDMLRVFTNRINEKTQRLKVMGEGIEHLAVRIRELEEHDSDLNRVSNEYRGTIYQLLQKLMRLDSKGSQDCVPPD